MKRNVRILLAALWILPLSGGAWTYDEVDFPGALQGWVLTLNSSKYTGPDGSTEWFRYTYTAGSGTNNYNFKMVTGNNWDQDYGGNTSFPKNQTAIMYYQPIGDTASQLTGGASNGYRYVFTTKNPGLSDTYISVMELTGDPVNIAAVSGGTDSYQTNDLVTFNVQLAGMPPAEEKVFIRYTTNGWTSFRIIQASLSGTNATATLTNLALNTTYAWYALTSTATSNYLASAGGFDVDALSLDWENQGGSNFQFATPGDAAWLWHNNNRVIVNGSNVQFWVKIGYCNGDGSDRWITNATIYYTTDGSTPTGSYGAVFSTTHAQAMVFDHTEQDSSPLGEAMWWVGTATNLPEYTTIKYRIGAWYDTAHPERFADYGSGTNNNVFSFTLGVLGDPVLRVNGVSADYTTTKFFINEIAQETQTFTVVFQPGVANINKVEIFSNLDRRDYADVDYTNAFIAADGYPDGIKGPDGNYITTNDVGAYYRAYPMAASAPGTYVWTGRVSKTGAYRLTARYTTNGMAANTWNWYSSGGRRDHAIVASPTKVHDMTMFELNTLTVEATYNNQDGRSTFQDLLSAAQGDTDGFDPFNLDYLNYIQANCLWFQPIHPNRGARGDAYTPGSPYATKDYFAVAPAMGTYYNEDSAMTEFTNFVAQADAYTGSVGTINVMLDGVFNHTAWDAVMGQGGVDLGLCASASASMGATKPFWYSLITDYGLPATYYNTAYDNDFATAPDRGDFGKWDDVTELYFGRYAALVRHNPDNNGDYLNEGDWFDNTSYTTNLLAMWRLFGYYPEYWIKKTGHSGTNSWVLAQDNKGIDGLRCDFGQGLPPQLWEYIINRTRAKKWNFMFMAETLDGGVPGYRSNRHFDILNENLVFRFTQEHINDSWAVKQALEDRRNSYSGGAILLNLTSHDEVLPDNDCWLVASRYGALSSVDGVPMIFYGQEQGIQNYNSDPSYWYYDGFRTDHEINFGKAIPQFKQWNQLMVWSNPPPNNTGLAQWYGRVNWARLNSPALRSVNRYFLTTTDGDDNARIFAVAKYQTANATPRTSDVVLAFANLFRHGEAHTLASDTYNLQPAWSLLGLNTGKYYNVRDLASSDASAYVWPTAKSGTELYNSGIYVSLGAGTVNPITTDGEIVQLLKLEEANQAPVISLPGPHILPVGSATNFSVSASDPDSDPVTLTNTVAPAGASFAAGVFSWTAGAANENTTNSVVFVANDQRGDNNSIVTNSTTITVPLDWDSDGMGDGWEWSNFSTLTNAAAGDTDGDSLNNLSEYIAGTQPTNVNSLFKVSAITNAAGLVNHVITVPTEAGRQYQIYYLDDSLATNSNWSTFANTNNGFGTWLEPGPGSSTHSFVDNESTNTTVVTPATGHRFYRVKVRRAN